MRRIQNQQNTQLQNALLAQEVAEAAKVRQAERARARSADAVAKTPEKGIPAVDAKGGGPQGKPGEPRKRRYLPDGTMEDPGDPGQGPGTHPPRNIDIKI